MPKEVKQNRNTIDAGGDDRRRRRAGSTTWRKRRHGDAPSVAAASSSRGVELGDERADRAHDDGQVEQHVGDRSSPARCLPSSRAATARNAAPTDDRRQHERHGHEREQGAPAGEPVAGEDVGRGQPERDGQHRAERRLPQREPDDLARARAGWRRRRAPTTTGRVRAPWRAARGRTRRGRPPARPAAADVPAGGRRAATQRRRGRPRPPGRRAATSAVSAHHDGLGPLLDPLVAVGGDFVRVSESGSVASGERTCRTAPARRRPSRAG